MELDITTPRRNFFEEKSLEYNESTKNELVTIPPYNSFAAFHHVSIQSKEMQLYELFTSLRWHLFQIFSPSIASARETILYNLSTLFFVI